MKELSLTVFSEQLNTVFPVSLPEFKLPVELTLIQAVGQGSNLRQEQFALFFQGPAQPLLTQGTYCVAHEQLGTLMLFIVPIGQNGTGIQYQAVYNRLLNHTPAEK